MKDVIIIGAGIAGLTAGFELSKDNIDFQILEAQDKIGGTIQSLRIGDYLVESGPHTFSTLNTEVFKLIQELGIEDELLEASQAANKRYIYLNGQLVEVPKGPKEFFTTNILSKDAKWTLFEELFIKKVNNEETVEDFISRRFGRDILKNLVQPFLTGVYAGDVKKLSANAVFPKLKELENKHNSIIVGLLLSSMFKGKRKKLTLYSFKDGMETLPNKLYDRVKNKVIIGAKDIEISKAKDFFIVTFKLNNKTINYTANSLLFAIPAFKMQEYSYIFPNNFLNNFTDIEYTPIGVVSQAASREKINFDLNGFGFLCTKEPHRKLLGSVWASSTFPNRGPADKILFTSYIGGAYYRNIIDKTEDEIKATVTKELCEIFKISSPDILETIHIKIHPYAIPQYNIGHLEKVKKIEEVMDKNYGIFFTGNYLHGISMNDTIKTSKIITEKIKRFLDTIKRSEIKTKEQASVT